MTSVGYKGIVKGNMVVLQEETPWPDGTPVVVVVAEAMEQEPDWEADPFLRVDEWLPDLPWEEVPSDLSVRHDDYAYGNGWQEWEQRQKSSLTQQDG
jgi:hypothetical protein